MCLIIVLTDHSNSDVLHFLIGLSEEILLFELLHHGWDSYSDNSRTEQAAVPPNDDHTANPVRNTQLISPEHHLQAS